MHNTKDFKGTKPTRIFTTEPLAKRIAEITHHQFRPKKVLDICCGNFAMSEHFEAEKIGYDIQDTDHKVEGVEFIKTNFLEMEEAIEGVDLLVCNPPFNGHPNRKLYPEVFLNKMLELYPNTPIILITPIGLTYNQRVTSKRWKSMKDIQITSTLILPLDVFSTEEQKVEIHTNVLFINFDKAALNPVYFLEAGMFEPEPVAKEVVEKEAANDKQFEEKVIAFNQKSLTTKEENNNMNRLYFTQQDKLSELFIHHVCACGGKVSYSTILLSQLLDKIEDKSVNYIRKRISEANDFHSLDLAVDLINGYFKKEGYSCFIFINESEAVDFYYELAEEYEFQEGRRVEDLQQAIEIRVKELLENNFNTKKFNLKKQKQMPVTEIAILYDYLLHNISDFTLKDVKLLMKSLKRNQIDLLHSALFIQAQQSSSLMFCDCQFNQNEAA
jgi:hypothetical protein